MDQNLKPERGVHGEPWGQMHGGYFSDLAGAQPLVAVGCAAWADSRPEVVVDLGGGTGFLLSQLRVAGVGKETALVNLDCSPAQLEVAEAAGVRIVCGSVDGFHRADVVPAGRKALFMMRSVLHYAGEAGLTPLLRHLRAQMEPGEFWIHQTACFERKEDADCLNALYRHMHTGKWYPTLADLWQRLRAADWEVEMVAPAPALPLEAEELGRRYGLDKAELRNIGEAMAKEFCAKNAVFQIRSDGFRADLHYRIFVCRAGT